MSEIKCCPFCGHRAAVTNGIMDRMTFIICTNYVTCGATVSFDCSLANNSNEDTVVRLWNKRRGMGPTDQNK